MSTDAPRAIDASPEGDAPGDARWSSDAGPLPCGTPASDDERLAVFKGLTATSWKATVSEGDTFYTTRLALRQDGTHTWERREGQVGYESGKWGFLLHDALSGILFFEYDWTPPVSFRFEQGRLSVPNGSGGGYLTHSPDMVLPSAGDPATNARNLMGLPASSTYAKVRGSTWDKTNSFDLWREPTSLFFDPQGCFWAVYRYGECSHGGHYYLQGHTWNFRADSHDHCDLRGGGTPAGIGPEKPYLLDDMLVHYYSSYRRRPAPLGPNVFVAGATEYPPIRIVGKFAGPLRRASATSIEFTYQNVADVPGTLKHISVRMQKLRFDEVVEKNFVADGPETILLEKNYTASLAPAAEYVDTVGLIPDTDGPYVQLWFKFELETTKQPYPFDLWYIVPVDP